jgi:hypothetical protein
MTAVNKPLSGEDADRLRAYERQRHDQLAATYHDFFTPVTSLAIKPLLNAVQVWPGSSLLDVATGPGSCGSAKSPLNANQFPALPLRRLSRAA